MKALEKLFGGISMTWGKVVAFAVVAGVYTGIVNQIPALAGTSFRDIAVTYEWWVLFAVIIATNTKTAAESALKVFAFFVISQPLVFLVELPMIGPELALTYYLRWLVPTLLTLPGGYIAFYIKKDSVIGALLLLCATAFLAFHLASYGLDCFYHFPAHLLTCLFIVAEIVVFVAALQHKAPYRVVAAVTAVVALAAALLLDQSGTTTYSVPLPEGDWTCVTDLAEGTEVSIEDGSLILTYNSNTFQEQTIVLQGEDGSTYTLEAAKSGDSIRLTPQE